MTARPVIALDPAAAAPLALPALAAALLARGIAAVAAAAAPGREGPVGAQDADGDLALLAAHVPLHAAPSLSAAAAAAAATGADVVLAAGALPEAALRIACLPARTGPRRLPWPFAPRPALSPRALARADLLLLVGTPAECAAFALRHPGAPPILPAEPQLLATGMDWSGERLFLVAPADLMAPLAALLRAAGAEVAGGASLDGAATLPRPLLARIAADARARGARIAAPETAAVRLPAAVRRTTVAVPLRLALPETAPLAAALARAGIVPHSQQET